MQHSCATLTFKPLILLPHTLYVLSPLSSCFWLFFYTFCFLPGSIRILQRSPEDGTEHERLPENELLHFISSYFVDLICIQKSNLNSSSSFRFPGFSALRSDRTHSFGLAFFLLMTHTLATSSFSSGKAYPSLNFLPPLSHFA